MKSIIFRGHDFGEICTARTTMLPLAVAEPKTRSIPGRPGALLFGGKLLPVEIKVRLMLRTDRRMDAAMLSEMRHKLSGWLAGTEGGELVLPEEPELTYRDCVVTDVKAWDALFEGGNCNITFTAHDPVAYGPKRTVTDLTFEVGGARKTWPVLTVRASASKTFMVLLDDTYHLTFTNPTSNNDIVVFDCQNERAFVNGKSADTRVTFSSQFFGLAPGRHVLSLRACTLVSCEFCERWY